jgi:hypothetical protein
VAITLMWKATAVEHGYQILKVRREVSRETKTALQMATILWGWQRDLKRTWATAVKCGYSHLMVAERSEGTREKRRQIPAKKRKGNDKRERKRGEEER